MGPVYRTKCRPPILLQKVYIEHNYENWPHQKEVTIYPRYAAVECECWALWLWSLSSKDPVFQASQAHPHSIGFPAAGAPAQCWHKSLYSHRMDWIDELIYPKLSQKNVWDLLQLDRFSTSPCKQLDATVGSSKHRRQIDVGKNCLALRWVYGDAAVSPNVNFNLEKRNAA